MENIRELEGHLVRFTDPSKEPFGGSRVGRVVQVFPRKKQVRILPNGHKKRGVTLDADKVELVDEKIEDAQVEEIEATHDDGQTYYEGHPRAIVSKDHPQMGNAITSVPDMGGELAMSVGDAVGLITQFEEFMGKVMKEEIDYGKVPGVDKPFLFQSGAQWLLKLMGYYTDLEVDWDHSIEIFDRAEPHFHYLVKAVVKSKRTGQVVGTGWGSCNSMENKYRWRDGKRTCPYCDEATIYKSKFPTDDGPPGFYCYKKMGGCGEQFTHDDDRILGQKEGRIENPDLADLANTILKMAQKRAEVGAAHRTTIAGRFFTQDEESVEAQGTIDAKWKDPVGVVPTSPPPPTVSEGGPRGSGGGAAQPESREAQDSPPPPSDDFQPPREVQDRMRAKESAKNLDEPTYREDPEFIKPTEKQLDLLRKVVVQHKLETAANPVAIKFPAWAHVEMGFVTPPDENAEWIPLSILNKTAMSRLLSALLESSNWEKKEPVQQDVPF